jgi:membrane protein implicated in regulation of membrane protease activity
MLLILALILALIFVAWPWNFVIILIAAVWEVSFAVVGVRYTRRRRARVGVETMIGTTAVAVTRLAPDGQVKVNGEIWEAHSEQPADIGETVRIKAVHGLTLEVEPRRA